MGGVGGTEEGAAIFSWDNQGRLHKGGAFEIGLGGSGEVLQAKTGQGTWDREEHVHRWRKHDVVREWQGGTAGKSKWVKLGKFLSHIEKDLLGPVK